MATTPSLTHQQPITAARLFVTSLDSASLPLQAVPLIRSAESALTTAEALLAGLLDISRLDAGAEEVRLEHLEIRALLEPLVGEFRLLAREKGRQLRYAASSAIAYTDAPFTGGSSPGRTTATPRYACWWRRRQWDQSSRWAVLWTVRPSHRAGAGAGAVSRGQS